MPQPVEHPRFKVGKQTMTTEPNGNGGVHPVWRVPYVTESGAEGHIMVPDHEYTADHVARLLTDKVAHVEQVAQIGQPAAGADIA